MIQLTKVVHLRDIVVLSNAELLSVICFFKRVLEMTQCRGVLGEMVCH